MTTEIKLFSEKHVILTFAVQLLLCEHSLGGSYDPKRRDLYQHLSYLAVRNLFSTFSADGTRIPHPEPAGFSVYDAERLVADFIGWTARLSHQFDIRQSLRALTTPTVEALDRLQLEGGLGRSVQLELRWREHKTDEYDWSYTYSSRDYQGPHNQINYAYPLPYPPLRLSQEGKVL